jgi:16S rRNA G527 N7-methylase RsmG
MAKDSVLGELIRERDFFCTPEGESDRSHSITLDNQLGFNIENIEAELSKCYRTYNEHHLGNNEKSHFEGTQAWIGLHPQILQTPYAEILKFLELVKDFDIKNIVDLGAGYGRVGIVQQSIFPEANFLGYEIIDERVKEGKRVFEELGLQKCEMVKKDILAEDYSLPDADLIFIYDFSDPMDLKVILNKISDIIFKKNFFFVAKGAGIRSMISNKYPQFWSLNGAVHSEQWSLYSSHVDLNQL